MPTVGITATQARRRLLATTNGVRISDNMVVVMGVYGTYGDIELANNDDVKDATSLT